MFVSGFDLNGFINKILGRNESFFSKDILEKREAISEKVDEKAVLVIGGAGTIGLSFIKALLRYGKPTKVIVVDINENGLTEVVRDIRSSQHLNTPKTLITYPLDFSSSIFKKIFLQEGPFDIVANFAAHKHVRSEKDIYAIEAMIKNNVLNAKHLLELLITNPPSNFFCVSTDKAANPVNIMGASKKLMEDLVLSYSNDFPISTARFANVAFSNGSLPFGFLERIMKRQPLSSPRDIKRFFVSPDEAGEICMMACLFGKEGDIFFPKLNAELHMHTFTYIANALLQELGYLPAECESEEDAKNFFQNNPESENLYPVYYFNSDTSGEKPYEEFFTRDEQVDLSTFASLGVIKRTRFKTKGELSDMIEEMENSFLKEDVNKQQLVSLIATYISGFEHIEKGKSLDQKM